MLHKLALHQQSQIQEYYPGSHDFAESTGGHMAYHRLTFVNESGEPYFIKAHDSRLISESWRQIEMASFLKKEASIYDHLQKHKFHFVPPYHHYREDILVLSGLTEAAGWYWRAPKEQRLYEKYITETIEAFTTLELLPPPEERVVDEISLNSFYDHGWDKLHNFDVEKLIMTNLEKWKTILHPETIDAARYLVHHIGELAITRAAIAGTHFNHHDARQSNIAWHPRRGVAIVDWSWADNGLHLGDSTMFLLDLHKSGNTIRPYQDFFNDTYAKLVFGYWLQRSQTEHMEGNQNVRLQQFISAITASELLLRL